MSSLTPPNYDQEKYYLRKQYYKTKRGDVKISYSLIERTAKSTKRGPAFKVNLQLSENDYTKISDLRGYNAPWKNIAASYGTTAYHLKKVYENFQGQTA